METQKQSCGKQFAVGARVRYTQSFIRSIGAEPTDSWWAMHGTIIEQTGKIARVKWDEWDRPSQVVARNLEVVK